MRSSPLFEVTVAAAAGDARRLTTAANVREMIGSPSGDDALLTKLIDRAGALMAGYCDLARDAGGTLPTFGVETCRATWLSGDASSSIYSSAGSLLALPWRGPITIAGLTVDGVALTSSTDFRLKTGALLERLSGDAIIPWGCAKVIATYTAGYTLPASVPPDLEAAAIEQVKYWYMTRARDPSLRSMNMPDTYQAAFSVAGGDSIGDSGLLVSVEGALGPYKNWATE